MGKSVNHDEDLRPTDDLSCFVPNLARTEASCPHRSNDAKFCTCLLLL